MLIVKRERKCECSEKLVVYLDRSRLYRDCELIESSDGRKWRLCGFLTQLQH